MKKPSRQKPQRLSDRPQRLTIEISDNDDISTFFLVLLIRGYEAWLCTNKRLASLEKGMTFRLPLHSDLSWKAWRGVMLPVVRSWWEEYTDYHEPKHRKGTSYNLCSKIIERVLTALTKDEANRPTYKGKLLTKYRLTELMYQEHDAPSRDACAKYAKLWFVRQKCAAPETLTYSDLLFLKRHDPRIRIEGDPRRMLPFLRQS